MTFVVVAFNSLLSPTDFSKGVIELYVLLLLSYLKQNFTLSINIDDTSQLFIHRDNVWALDFLGTMITKVY